MQIGVVNLRLLKKKTFSSLLYKDFIQILSKASGVREAQAENHSFRNNTLGINGEFTVFVTCIAASKQEEV